MIISVGLLTCNSAYAQEQEMEQLILDYEKLQQLEKILDNMYAGYKILDYGYTTIKNIAEGNYKLHQAFLDGLFLVNPAVRNYKRIPYIIDYQKLLVKEYKNYYTRFKNDPNFKPEELEYIGNVYSFLVQASLRNIDDLIMITTATKLRMSDDERMKAIDRIYYDLEGKVVFIRSFNNNTQLLAIQRARSANDVRTLRHIYGLN
ncbi:MAG: TerB family tellurite resistance protein [Bacteroidetes bacterium]|nr:TerB family tellurite resistance protein [Bacteroidota bacterium]MBS1950711.1 TerB family tellurite resistance protein [Bacteroidota bacterium]MBS1980729.1 TerB family tellurite resistance protein [Bacteroidota bacterium]